MPYRPPTLHQAARDFLSLPERVKPAALSRLTFAEVAEAIEDARVAILVTDSHLRIRGLNLKAKPSFQHIPDVMGRPWPDVLREYWSPTAAEEIARIVQQTLASGTPYSSIGFAAGRAKSANHERFDWEIHRFVTADGERMLVCYFVGGPS